MAYDTQYLAGPIYFGSKANARFWVYDDTVVAATVIGSGYISDGFKRGLQLGDFVFYRQYSALVPKSGTPAVSIHTVTVQASATNENTTLSSAYGSASGLTVPVATSTGNPGVTDDISPAGYVTGSLWINTTSGSNGAFVALSNADGAAIWRPIVNQVIMDQDAVGINTAGTTGQVRIPVPFNGNLIRAIALVTGATTSAGSAVLTFSRNATAVTNGVITVAGTSGIGSVATCTPTALNSFTANDVLNGIVSGTQSAAASLNVVALFERTS